MEVREVRSEEEPKGAGSFPKFLKRQKLPKIRTSIEQGNQFDLKTPLDKGCNFSHFKIELVYLALTTTPWSCYHKYPEPLYHSFIYLLVSLLSGIYPLPAMH